MNVYQFALIFIDEPALILRSRGHDEIEARRHAIHYCMEIDRPIWSIELMAIDKLDEEEIV